MVPFIPMFCSILVFTAQNMKFSIKDFFSKCDQIRCFLRIWSYLLKKSYWKTTFLWGDWYIVVKNGWFLLQLQIRVEDKLYFATKMLLK